MSLPSTHAPRRRILAAALPAALLAGLTATAVPTGAASAAGDDGEPPPPPKTITISGLGDPFYGDDLTFNVRASGGDNWMSVFDGDPADERRVFGPVEMSNVDPTPVRIPTTGTYRAGQTYRFVVSATNDVNTGTKGFTFTPKFIPSDLTLAGLTQEYGLPLYGRLDATIPTTVKPGGGTMALKRGGAVTARYAIRPDGTYALLDLGMLPGTHRGVQFYYEGDQNYAAQALGTGLETADVTITRQHTTTTAALTRSQVVTGDAVEVLASVASSNQESQVDPTGRLEVHVSPDGQAFEKIADVAYPGGKQQVRVPITDWARTHPGVWTVRTVYAGDDVSFASAADSALQVVPPGTATKATATALTLSSATTTVQSTTPVTATAAVTSAAGPVTSGSVQFTVRGTTVATVPVGADGRATAPITAASTGESLVVASYLGTTEFSASASPASPLTASPATTTTTVAVPTQPAPPGSILSMQVRANGSTLVPSGTVVVTEGSTFLGSVALANGQAQLKLPVLTAGTHQLTVSYAGSQQADRSTTTVAYPVAAPGPVGKQVSSTALKVKKVKKGKAKVVVSVTSDLATAGTVQVLRGGKVVGTATLTEAARGQVTLTTKRLPKGVSRLTARFLGSVTVDASQSAVVKVRVTSPGKATR